VHFDLHGAVLSWDQLQKGAKENQFTFNGRYGRSDLAAFEGKKGFLFFENDKPDAKDKADPAEASKVAALLPVCPVVQLSMINQHTSAHA
jgi:hypothetical protein